MTDSNQALAAEPGFHCDTPRRGGFEVTAVRRFPDYRSELAEQQPENGLRWRLAQHSRWAASCQSAQAVRLLRQR